MATLSSVFLLSVVIASCAAFCAKGVYDQSVSGSDINVIVNKHNHLRWLISQGKVPGQPRGNLQNLEWDQSLAQAAQNIANNCKFEHVTVNDNRYWYVGQNLYTFASTDYRPGADWDGIIQSWFNEYKHYKYPGYSKETGHYTQIVWAGTSKVGCGYTYYPDDAGWYRKLYVCNYGPGGNIQGQAPY